MPLGGKPVLVHVIERLRHARRVSSIVVASSDGADDDRIADVTRAHECQVYRGSLEDVLGRYAGAAKAANADIVVRITADCPLVCGVVVDGMIERYSSAAGASRKPIVVTNARQRTFPRGLDAEVFDLAALDIAAQNARAAHQREHVTPYLYEHPEAFEIIDYVQSQDLSAARWTLDTPDDYRMLSEFFRMLGAGDDADLDDLVRIWNANPALHAINAGVVQKSHPVACQQTDG